MIPPRVAVVDPGLPLYDPAMATTVTVEGRDIVLADRPALPLDHALRAYCLVELALPGWRRRSRSPRRVNRLTGPQRRTVVDVVARTSDRRMQRPELSRTSCTPGSGRQQLQSTPGIDTDVPPRRDERPRCKETCRLRPARRPLVAAHGGEILAISAGGADVIEGDGPPPLLAFHRWPSRECFDRFWNSPEYAPLRALRHQACDTRITVFES